VSSLAGIAQEKAQLRAEAEDLRLETALRFKQMGEEKVAEVAAGLARLRAALEWYREQVAGLNKLTTDEHRDALAADGGRRASAALESVGGPSADGAGVTCPKSQGWASLTRLSEEMGP
jgi:hypothetical protein